MKKKDPRCILPARTFASRALSARLEPVSLLLLAIGCFLFSQTLLAQIPSGFLEGERITSTAVRNGVMLHTISGSLQSGDQKLKQEIYVLEIDRGRPDLSMEAVVGGRRAAVFGEQFFQRSHPQQFLQDHKLLAVLNASFFDIGATQSPWGLVIRDGQVLRTPASNRTAMLMAANGGLYLNQPGWEAELVYQGQSVPLLAVNEPGKVTDGVVMYLPPWVRTLGRDGAFLDEPPAYELVMRLSESITTESDWTVMRGTVVDKRERKSARNLKNDEFVLVPYGDKAQQLLDRSRGEQLQVRWRLTGLPEGVSSDMIREAVSAGPVLVSGSKRNSGTTPLWRARHPRSAVGWSDAKDKIWWVLVDGRSQQSAGISLIALGEFFEFLGAEQALNLDGGGSSVLAVSISGRGRVVNTPSDGKERFVPTGIGLREK